MSIIVESANDNLQILTKRSTFAYKLPNTVLRGSSQASLIQKESFNVDWTDATNDAPVSNKTKVRNEGRRSSPCLVALSRGVLVIQTKGFCKFKRIPNIKKKLIENPPVQTFFVTHY